MHLNSTVKGSGFEDYEHLAAYRLYEYFKYQVETHLRKTQDYAEILEADAKDINPEIYEEYGNNYFELNTYDWYTTNNLEKDKSKLRTIRMAGILKEMPEIGWGTEWENGPGAGIADLLGKKIDLDIVNTVGWAAGVGNDLKNFVNTDVMTNHIYKTSNPFEITLNFRIYTGQNIGSLGLTSAKKWIENLHKAAAPNSSNQLNILDAKQNIVTTLDNISISKFKDNFDLTKANDKFSGSLKMENSQGIESDYNMTENSNGFGKNRAKEDGIVDYRIGAKLFHLKIYSWLYGKNPLTVYIKSWEVTPSKEWNVSLNDHFYYDFKITCASDQVLSAPTWLEMFAE